MSSPDKSNKKIRSELKLSEHYFLNDLRFEVKKSRYPKQSELNQIYSKMEYLNDKIIFLNERVDYLNQKISYLRKEMANRLETLQAKVKTMHKRLIIGLSLTAIITLSYIVYLLFL